MNNTEIAKSVIEAIGGKDNVSSVAHCATRLRIMVKDKEKIDTNRVENIEKVQGAFFNAGQFQIIFGTGTVNRIYDEVVSLGLPTSTTSEMKAEAAKQGNWFQRAVRTFGDVFVPIIPAIVATGLFMGLRGLLEAFGVVLPSDFLIYSKILTDTAFIALPALVVWSTFKVFGGNQTIGIVLGLMLISGSLPNAWEVAQGGEIVPIKFFGLVDVVGLQGSVLPAFIIGVVGANFEKWVRKYVPEVLDLLVTPFITLFVMSILGLFVLGPIFHQVEKVILSLTTTVLYLPFGLGGLIIGGTHQLIVVSGVHHIFNLLEINLLSATGQNPFNAIITAAMTAQGAAAVAIGVKTKSPKLKALTFPAALSAFLGITEPVIFGVNLRFRKPFVLSLLAGALGGALSALLGLAGTSNGITIIPGSMLYVGNGQLPQYLFMVAVSFALGFTFTYLFGYDDSMLDTPVEAEGPSSQETQEEEPVVATSERADEKLRSPIVGEVVALSEVNDPVFSSGVMGQGIAVKPSKGVVYAPADAEIAIAFPTGHAYGLKTDNGAEILIHVGIDTVSLNGEGFEAKVSQGDRVRAGDIIGTFDSEVIAANGLDDTTMVIITNTMDYAEVTPIATGSVTNKTRVLELHV
ncbi:MULTISPECIES: PTS beta-glucoside transporter subunit IIBCA [unclassified Granulicatella]|jgi:PTS system, glucose subfamily, IIA component|uniref:PTS beta-glucoside transporter subunit IIBCA n=1 Tax=unclassified Granulicatella TaxID=2630493 RepID=UPI00065F9AD1|nr:MULTISPECIES: PTS beta-glucoside transporter subunit IIBCA [unclassified Granulicatella]MBF1709985.1 PTS glucose transporter subunit IIA [Streptococcus sp.]MDK8381383.1 glucose PTS transporter subunit IIA [Granulicatella sp. UMB5615B]MDK8521965.1 glucose PTS transporter subunit IIA [Granulicatella sp. UMB5615A]